MQNLIGKGAQFEEDRALQALKMFSRVGKNTTNENLLLMKQEQVEA